MTLWGFLLATTYLGRTLARRIAGRASPRERCFLIGDARTLERLRGKLAHHAHTDLVGSVAADEIEVSESALSGLARRHSVHRLLVAPGHVLSEDSTLELVRAAKATGLRVSLLPGMLATVGSSVVFDDLWGMTILGVPRFGLTNSTRLLKATQALLRPVDRRRAARALFPAAAADRVVIRLDSQGAPLFRQTRVGRGGAQFEIRKFRTMVREADRMREQLQPLNEASGVFKIARDPRVTRVGRWRRSTSLDELPQLLNMMRGEMSLVGPRPLVVDEDNLITGFDRRRLSLTPGMTGQWQILARSECR